MPPQYVTIILICCRDSSCISIHSSTLKHTYWLSACSDLCTSAFLSSSNWSLQQSLDGRAPHTSVTLKVRRLYQFTASPSLTQPPQSVFTHWGFNYLKQELCGISPLFPLTAEVTQGHDGSSKLRVDAFLFMHSSHTLTAFSCDSAVQLRWAWMFLFVLLLWFYGFTKIISVKIDILILVSSNSDE